MKLNSIYSRGLQTGWAEACDGDKKKPILLCFHGFPDDPISWDAQIKYFAKKWHVVAPYSRGVGRSEPCSNQLQRYSPESAVLDAADILNHIDPNKEKDVYVMGHDLGVVLAWSWARSYESRTKGLIMIGGFNLEQMCRRLSWPRQHLKSWYIYMMQIPGFANTLLSALPKPMQKLATILGDRPEAYTTLSGAELAQGVYQYRAFSRKIKTALQPTKRKLKVPVLSIWGSEDAFLLPPTQTELNKDAHDVTIRVLTGNHWIHREKPELVNSLIEEFLNANRITKNTRESVTHRKTTNARKSIPKPSETTV